MWLLSKYHLRTRLGENNTFHGSKNGAFADTVCTKTQKKHRQLRQLKQDSSMEAAARTLPYLRACATINRNVAGVSQLPPIALKSNKTSDLQSSMEPCQKTRWVGSCALPTFTWLRRILTTHRVYTQKFCIGHTNALTWADSSLQPKSYIRQFISTSKGRLKITW
jgi:hypothetical protein